jgi:hypothetical protein
MYPVVQSSVITLFKQQVSWHFATLLKVEAMISQLPQPCEKVIVVDHTPLSFVVALPSEVMMGTPRAYPVTR